MKHSFLPPKVITVVLVSAFLFTSCISYYKTSSLNPWDLKKIDSLNTQKKNFILHNGSYALDMTGMLIDIENSSIKCKLISKDVPSIYTPSMKKSAYIYNKAEKNVLNEVHFITKMDSAAVAGTDYTLPINSIQRAYLIQKDKEKTKRSHLIGYTVLGVAIIVNIVFASSSMFILGGLGW